MIDIITGATVSLYQQIYEQLKNKIISGELEEGTRLPSTRALAKNLCVARNTVESSYAQLCVEGYVSSKPGSGYYVMNVADDSLFNDLAPDTEKSSAKVRAADGLIPLNIHMISSFTILSIPVSPLHCGAAFQLRPLLLLMHEKYAFIMTNRANWICGLKSRNISAPHGESVVLLTRLCCAVEHNMPWM